MNPAGFHATNVVLHLAAVLVFFFAFLRLTGAAFRSFLVAAVFALHPLHVESVAWIAARKDVLSGLFAALALLCYAGAARVEPRRYAWVAFWLACGLLAKPTLVVWPFVLLALDLWPLRRFERDGRFEPSRLWPLLREKLSFFVLAGAVSVITLWTQASSATVRSFDDFPFATRLANALASLAHYTADVVAPRDLAVFYPYPLPGSDSVAVVAGALLLLAGFGLAVAKLSSAPFLITGWAWYVGSLLPVIGLVQVGQAARADRYTYLPLLGLSIVVIWGGDALARSPRAQRLAAAAALVALLVFAGLARVQLETWRDSGSLFSHALRVTERNHVAHINLGLVLLQQDRLDDASSHLMAALRLAPRSAIANGLLAQVRSGQGRQPEAVRHYRRALELEPDSERWQRALAAAQASRSDR